jgi:hypothetical protein
VFTVTLNPPSSGQLCAKHVPPSPQSLATVHAWYAGSAHDGRQEVDGDPPARTRQQTPD